MFFLSGLSVQAQTSLFTSTPENATHVLSLDTTKFGLTHLIENYQSFRIKDDSPLTPFSIEKQLYSYPFNLSQPNSVTLPPIIGTPNSNFQGLAEITTTEKKSIKDITYGLPLNLKPANVTVSDYIILPNKKSDFVEFHDHETTLSGTTVDLSTISLSARYADNLPASSGNGATVAQNAVYRESVTGSGGLPWFVANAPNSISGTSIELNTYSNLLSQSSIGSYNINIPNGNTLQIATGDNGGYVGWTDPNPNTKLSLGAGTIDITGHLVVENSITSVIGVTVGNPNLSNASLSYNSLTFSNANGVQCFVGTGVGYTNGHSQEGALVVMNKSAGGIILDASTSIFDNSNAITFVINANEIGKFESSGLIIGQGFGDPSAILSINSQKQGVLIPRCTTEQIFNINNPSEGLLVYNLDYHKIVFYNGNYWRYSDNDKKMRRPKFNTNSN